MKMIFLDIDGVLNTMNTYRKLERLTKEQQTLDTGYYLFDRSRVKLLNQIPNNIYIIMSSSWRNLYPVNDIFRMLRHNGYRRNSTLSMIDRSIREETRGAEIVQCILGMKAKDPNFVAIDDDASGMQILEDRFIYINDGLGLRQSHIDRTLKLLKG
jgi:hypothetical protein